MKNLLIATTALVATAGVAAADITFSGGARFGVTHSGSMAQTAKNAAAQAAQSAASSATYDALVGNANGVFEVVDYSGVNDGFLAAADRIGGADYTAPTDGNGAIAFANTALAAHIAAERANLVTLAAVEATNTVYITDANGVILRTADADDRTAAETAAGASSTLLSSGTGDASTELGNAAASLQGAEFNTDDLASVAAVSGAAVASNATESSSDIHNRFTLNIDGSTETDSGVEFFARVRIRGGNTGTGATSGSSVSAPRVGATMGGLTIAVGNINGALESTPGLYSGNVGLTGLGWGSLPTNNNVAGGFAWDAFSSGGGGSNGVEVIYSSNGFGVHVSHSGASNAARTAINVSYNFSDWTVALGHQSSDTVGEDTTVLTVGGTIGNVAVGFAHADNEGDRDATRVNATFEVGAGTKVTTYYTAASGAGREDSYGLGFTHSLGGATLAGGVANSFTGQTVADLGVRFNF